MFFLVRQAARVRIGETASTTVFQSLRQRWRTFLDEEDFSRFRRSRGRDFSRRGK